MYSLSGRFRRAIVTGGAGFIGSHLVDSLLDDGLEVISIDDYSGGKSENLAHLKENKLFREVKCDITNLEDLRQYFEGVDIVFHQAVSKMTICLKNPRRDLEVNALGTFNILELCRDFEVKKYVHASTGSVYGEATYYPTDELHSVNPTSYYGVSKLAGEKYARVFSHLYDLNVSMLRYYHVYGTRQENSEVGGVVSIFARRALQGLPLIIYGDGTQLRSFTSVRDIVRINKLVSLADCTNGHAYNCASGDKVTIGELARKILVLLDRDPNMIEYRDWKIGDIVKFDVSNTKLKLLGMSWETPFDVGLAETIEWSKKWLLDSGNKLA